MFTALLLAGLAIIGQTQNDAQPSPELPAEWVIDVRIEGAVVRPSYRLGSMRSEPYPLAEVFAGSDGMARVDLLPLTQLSPFEIPTASLEATVYAPGRNTESVYENLPFFPAISARLFSFSALPRGTAIAGRVLDDEGRPVANARVRSGRWNAASDNWEPGASRSTETDVHGAFSFEVLAPPHDTVMAIHANHGAVRRSLNTDEKLIELRLFPVSTPVRGVVVGPNGEPLPGFDLIVGPVHYESEWPISRLRLRSDEQGRFELHLPMDAGEWTVRSLIDRGNDTAPSTRVAPGQQDVVVRFSRPHVRVRVVDDRGREVRGMWTEFHRVEETTHGLRAHYSHPLDSSHPSTPTSHPSTQNGWIAIPGPGLYLATVLYSWQIGRPYDAERLVRIEPGQDLTEITLTLQPSKTRVELHLAVLDPSGLPTSDWIAYPRSAETGFQHERFVEDGVSVGTCMPFYAVPALPPGPYRLTILSRGDALPIEHAFEVRAGEPLHLELRFPGYGGRVALVAPGTNRDTYDGSTLHFERKMDGNTSGPWHISHRVGAGFELRNPIEQPYASSNILLEPGTWTFALRDSQNTVIESGEVEIVARHKSYIRLGF